jgi:hypothetical protein
MFLFPEFEFDVENASRLAGDNDVCQEIMQKKAILMSEAKLPWKKVGHVDSSSF